MEGVIKKGSHKDTKCTKNKIKLLRNNILCFLRLCGILKLFTFWSAPQQRSDLREVKGGVVVSRGGRGELGEIFYKRPIN